MRFDSLQLNFNMTSPFPSSWSTASWRRTGRISWVLASRWHSSPCTLRLCMWGERGIYISFYSKEIYIFFHMGDTFICIFKEIIRMFLLTLWLFLWSVLGSYDFQCLYLMMIRISFIKYINFGTFIIYRVQIIFCILTIYVYAENWLWLSSSYWFLIIVS